MRRPGLSRRKPSACSKRLTVELGGTNLQKETRGPGMRFDPADRRRLKEEMDSYKEEMDVSYREIKEIDDKLSELTQQRRDLEYARNGLQRRIDRAKESGDFEELTACSEAAGRALNELIEMN